MTLADLAALRTFYLSDALGGHTLFDIWERGDAWGDSVTPATYSLPYRTWIVEKLMRFVVPSGANELLSLGCGNAFVEAECVTRGWQVLAVDALPQAVALARRKGVDAVVGDVLAWQPPHAHWQMIYADGLLGHVWEPSSRLSPMLSRVREWLAPDNGFVLLSNDAPPAGVDVASAPGVPGFCWLSINVIMRELETSGFRVLASEEFAYERPRSGTRHRAVVVGAV
jgi:SAM-dependent methyltransferase